MLTASNNSCHFSPTSKFISLKALTSYLYSSVEPQPPDVNFPVTKLTVLT